MKDRWRNAGVLAALAVVTALPFVFQKDTAVREWREGDPVVVVVTPMNEAIREEYGRAFAAWHAERWGRPAKVDWRNIGGSTEIARYLESEYTSAFRAWWEGRGRKWSALAASAILDKRFQAESRPDGADEAAWTEATAAREAFRGTDDAAAFGCGLDMYFGGGAFDADSLTREGLLVPLWGEAGAPEGLARSADGAELIPEGMSGETWRTETFWGTTLSTFGICFNRDRMAAAGISEAPKHWSDLADPRWAGTLGVADPTKSGSIAKAFETIVQVECRKAVAEGGWGEENIGRFEAAIAAAGLPAGEMPEGVPEAYQAAVEEGWARGVRLLQRIGANARYFTDSASKVPLDVAAGNAAAGICIDFYGLFEAETCNRGADGPMGYATPAGESGVSADPISMLRGAPHRETARRFAEFLLGEEGQKLWCYRKGEPGGPEKYALMRLPIRRDFYPGGPGEGRYEEHRAHTSRDLGAPEADAYALAAGYVYRARWTAGYFGTLRDLTRAMCLDSGPELKAAWRAILAAGGPEACPEAMAAMEALPQEPEPLTWRSGLTVGKRVERLELLRAWTEHFRRQYREAERLAKRKSPDAGR